MFICIKNDSFNVITVHSSTEGSYTCTHSAEKHTCTSKPSSRSVHYVRMQFQCNNSSEFTAANMLRSD